MSNKVVSLTFRHIIDDVIANVRQDFEDMGIEKEVLEELQRSWEAKLIATQVTEFDGASHNASSSRPPVQYTTTPGVDAGAAGTSLKSSDTKTAKTDSKNISSTATPSKSPEKGVKRKHEDDDQEASNDIGSDLDDSEEEDAEGNEDMMLCLYDKVQRVKNKWKCNLNARTVALIYVLLHFSRHAFRTLRAVGIKGVAHSAYMQVAEFVVRLLLKIPANRKRVEREMSEATSKLEKSLVLPSTVPSMHVLPVHGRDVHWIDRQMDQLQHMGAEGHDAERDWRDGRCSGAVYHGGDEVSRVILDALQRFLVSNPLHPEVFPGVRKMEAEVVAMVLSMFNAPSEAAGTTTSGGTESILMACKTARDSARVERGVMHPEMVIPMSAHVAFDKAGSYFGIKVRRVPVNRQSRKVDINAVSRSINSQTVLLVGSAPNFPDGIIDDIVALGALAKRHKILCHVDCCLGSFLVPFLDRAGFVSEPFDFRVAGVTSISCDTHKYGFAPKGSSIVMYHSQDLRRYQYYVNASWVGGVYASPTLAGSRPGALIAATWAVMVAMGQDGYTNSCREIVGAAKQIEQRIREEIPELTILGNPLVSLFAIGSAGVINIYDVGDQMSQRGWHLNAIGGDIPAIHLACTRLTVPVVDEFLRDLKQSVAQSRTKPASPGTMATVYGLGQSTAVGPMLVGDMASKFVDMLYKVAP
ncbi:sphinganine-1-phosphate aldolase [Malassezia yamatoensis]|uniref:Transcription initiation factor IIA large subunit n=1 Tax=Malassezia yamatoensis TaxID=253288 RepID=A0AAJ5YWZ1_9BASI|nr:sphinganine-1-phosphate aldolase [Malassezia yamatoensis]